MSHMRRQKSNEKAIYNRELAHSYLDAGYEVFPCKEYGPKGVIKTPYTRHGFKDATASHAQIDEWWDRWPGAVVGLPTGERNGIAVLDVDQKDGKDGRAALRAIGIRPRAIVVVETPSGGTHFVYTYQKGLRSTTDRTPAGDMAIGVDVRGESGYIIAPGNTLADGSRYRTTSNASLLDSDLKLSKWPRDLPVRERVESDPANDNSRESLPLEQFRTLLDDIADNRTHIDPETGKHYFVDGRDGWTAVLKAATNEYKDHPQLLKKAKRVVREFSEASFSWRAYEDGERNAEDAPQVFNDQWENFLSRAKRGQANPVTLGTLIQAASDDWKCEQRNSELLKWFDDPEERIREKVSTLEWFGSIEPSLSSTYLIKGLIDVGSLSVLWGNPKAGKTFLTLDMMFHLAAGLPWRGLRTRKAAVLYLALEGGNRIKNRIVALQMEHGNDPIPFALRRGGADLLKKDGDVKAITRMVREVQDEYPDLPVIVVVDTLSRALAGGDESSSVDMTAFVRNVDSIREKTGAHVMVVHHAGKDVSRGMRGHSSLMGAIDSELFVEHDDVKDVRTMRVGVQRDEDTTGREFHYRLRSVDVGIDQDGDPIRSAVCEPADKDENESGTPLPDQAVEAFRILKHIAGDSDLVPMKDWEAACVESDQFCASEDTENRKHAFRRNRKKLIEAKRIKADDLEAMILNRPIAALAAEFDDDPPPPRNNRRKREDLA